MPVDPHIAALLTMLDEAGMPPMYEGSPEAGATPPGVDTAHQRVRSASVVLPPDQPFKDGAREATPGARSRTPLRTRRRGAHSRRLVGSRG